MENIQQNFLDEAILKLENLLPLLSHENLDENLRREIFRTFHTLKGTSQTLGFNNPGKLAHELENLLQHHAENSADEKSVRLLREGTELLREILIHARDDQKNFYPEEFVRKLQSFLPESVITDADFFSDAVPPEMWKKLSVDEKKSLREASAKGKNLYEVEVEFSLSDFDQQFRRLLESLQNKGEIIANFPKPDVSEADKIGFRIFFVSFCHQDEMAETVQAFDAELVNFNSMTNFTNDLRGILEQTVFAGKKAAVQLNKNIEFKTATNDFEVPAQYLKLFSEVLLHLIRNAVDHAIEKDGTIKIEINSEKNYLILRVTDDGRGLDAEKIRAKAVEKNLIKDDENLSREEIFDLIFAHGFSTADKVSEISGRGVGLDVVRDAVEKASGKINVKSASNDGTVFEIRLPHKI